MSLPQPPDIPLPKPEDEDYMKVWHKYLQSDIDKYQIQRECDTWRRAFYTECDRWRRAFYTVAAFLFAFMFTMLVLIAASLYIKT